MHTTHLRKVGGSVMLALPPAILDMLRLQPGSSVGMTVDAGQLVIKPSPPSQEKPKYSLEELLAQCDPTAELTEEDREWLDAAPVGKELL